MLKITNSISIEDWEITEQFIRASGPGGQNVNKVSSAVELRFEAERSPNLPSPVKSRLRKLAGRRWTKEGAVILQVDETLFTFCPPGPEARMNVNKVSSAVELRFEAERSPNLPSPVKSRLRKLAGRRWTKEGAVILQVDETRSQARNREIARDRLAELIARALEKPKRRIPTKPTLGSKKRRLAGKKQRGEVKALRGKVAPDN